MHFLNYFNLKPFKYDLINKFYYNKTKNLPKFKKIILNFNCKTTKIKSLSSSLLALELITNKKGILTITKQPNILLKIRKGNPIGCKITLKEKHIFNFLERLLCEVLPKINVDKELKISNTTNKNCFYFEIKNTFNFKELENNYYLFNELNKLDIVIIFESQLGKEFNFMISSFKLLNLSK